MTWKKVDNNQGEIVKALRQLGCSVKSTADIGKGFPDLAVGWHGKNLLLEIKKDHKEKLTPDEKEFHDSWLGQVSVICSVDEAIKLINQSVFNS